MKERDHFLSKNMVNIPECGKLHLHLSNFLGGEPPDPPPKYVPPTLKMLLTPLHGTIPEYVGMVPNHTTISPTFVSGIIFKH